MNIQFRATIKRTYQRYKDNEFKSLDLINENLKSLVYNSNNKYEMMMKLIKQNIVKRC